jgi:solute carrier family 25 carnitine/acylcarnitine transporter 20/29
MADAAADMEENGMLRTMKDLFAGAAGGIAQVLLGEFYTAAYSIDAAIQSILSLFEFISRVPRVGDRRYLDSKGFYSVYPSNMLHISRNSS